MRQLSRAVGTCALGSAAAIAVTVAGPATPAEASGGTAPACVHRAVEFHPGPVGHSWEEATITNRCGKTMRVEILLEPRGSTACWTLGHGQSERWASQTHRYGKTVVC